MSQVSLIINVSDQSHSHSAGLAGTFMVPPKGDKEFSLLVVYPTREIQDVGNNAKAIHWPKPITIARDIIGRSDACAHTPGSTGTREKWGLLLCEAEPDMPKELMQAQDAEADFLNDNLPDYTMKKDKKAGIMVAVCQDSTELLAQRVQLSQNVADLKAKFESECRKLVSKAEVKKAHHHLQNEDQRLVAEGDAIWAGPEAGRVNVNENHKQACRRLGQNRPWCYVPEQLWSCPGCGAMIKENIITCGHCGAILDEEPAVYAKMTPKQKAMSLYPERYSEPAGVGGIQKGR